MSGHQSGPTLLAVTIVASLATGCEIHNSNRERAVAEFQDRQLHTADTFAAELRAQMTGAARTLQAVAAGVAATADADRVRAQLDAQMRCLAGPCFTAMAVYGADARLLYPTTQAPDLDPDQVRAAVDWARDPARREPVRAFLPSSHIPALVLTTPSAGGIAAAEIDFDSLFSNERGEPASDWHKYPTLVIDGRGNVIFHSRHPEMRMNNVAARTSRCASCHASLDYVDRLRAMQRGLLRYERRGVPQLAAVAPLAFEGDPWIAAVMSPADEAVSVLANESRQLGLLGAVSVVFLGAGIYRTSKSRSDEKLTALNVKLESAALEWRTTVDTIDAAVVVLDPSGDIERMNRAAASTLPGPLWSWTGRPSDTLGMYPPWDSALDLARAAIASGRTQSRRVTTRDGARTWDLWCRTHADRHRGAVVIVARDVTAVVALQESLRRSETMAALGSVVAGVAHEVRNPLFAISSMVDALSLGRHVNVTPFLDALRNEVGRLNTLMKELLDYGTPTTFVLKPNGLVAVIAEAMRACEPEAAERSVTVVQKGADAEVWMDPKRLVRVFINVIQNAIQYTEPGSLVTIAIEAVGGAPATIDVRVRDCGPGFQTEDLPRVFTPFFSRRAGGFGLGLAICERIVGEHHGRIEAANDPAGGAVVTISLPRTPPDGAMNAAEGVASC